MTLYIIHWIDTFTTDTKWRTNKKTPKPKPLTIISTGFKLHKTKNYITLAPNIIPSTKSNCSPINIPLKTILQISKVKVNKKPNK